MGAAAIAGFVASRFLRASAHRHDMANTGADNYDSYGSSQTANRDAAAGDYRTTDSFRDEMGGLH
jgi:uncharacterized membrane protein